MRKLVTVFVFLLASMSMVSYSIGPINNQLFKEYIDHLTARQLLEAQIKFNRGKINYLFNHPYSASYLRDASFMQKVRRHLQRTQDLEHDLVTLNGIISLYVHELGVHSVENEE